MELEEVIDEQSILGKGMGSPNLPLMGFPKETPNISLTKPSTKTPKKFPKKPLQVPQEIPKVP